MTAPRVTVVIPNWNGMQHLPGCIGAIEGQTFRGFRVIVVDNASSDDSVAWLRAKAPDVEVVQRDDNGGFAAAVNDGIVRADGEFVALLNNDTEVDPRWLESLIEALERTGYDFAAALMVFMLEPDVVNAAGDTYDMFGFAGRQRGRGERVADYATPVRVLGASAGAAMYRRDFFEDVGLFDESFFLLHEDTDINIRALIAGKRAVYVPEAVVLHKDSATIKQQPSEFMREEDLRNRHIVLAKDMPAFLLPYVAIMWLVGLVRDHLPLRRSKWHLIPSLLRRLPSDLAIGFQGLRVGWRKRHAVWGRRGAPHREIVRWLFDGVGRL
jgi:GT2 family glycosyltransferase